MLSPATRERATVESSYDEAQYHTKEQQWKFLFPLKVVNAGSESVVVLDRANVQQCLGA